MLKFHEKKLESVFKFLEGKKVFTLDQLVSSLSCSTPTARLKLKQWQTYTSYNQNGRYYTMPTVTFQYLRHPWLQNPWHSDSPYFPC